MSQLGETDDWIFEADREQLIAELRRQELATEGTDSVLALRLLRHERTTRKNGASREAVGRGGVSAGEYLEVPVDDGARPDSPFEDGVGAPFVTPYVPRLAGRRPRFRG